MRIAVLGGGNGSFAAAGDFALAGHDVRLWRRDTAAVEAHRAAGSAILIKDFSGQRVAKLSLVTNDIAEAVRDAELILCPAPAHAQADIAKALAPHLSDGQVVFLPPGTFGSMLFAQAHADGRQQGEGGLCRDRHPALAHAQARADFEAAITVRAKRLPTGVFPLTLKDHALNVIGEAFPGVIEDCGDALSGALMNAGPIIHPPLITMNAGPLEHFDRWDIHKEGTQASIRRVTDALDAERIAVREALGYRRAAFPARRPLRQGRRRVDVRPRLARQADQFRRLARAHRADAASLHAGGHAHRACRSSRRSASSPACRRRSRAPSLRSAARCGRGFHGDGADAEGHGAGAIRQGGIAEVAAGRVCA